MVLIKHRRREPKRLCKVEGFVLLDGVEAFTNWDGASVALFQDGVLDMFWRNYQYKQVGSRPDARRAGRREPREDQSGTVIPPLDASRHRGLSAGPGKVWVVLCFLRPRGYPRDWRCRHW